MPRTDSPFRYPGGKTQLYNFITKLLTDNNIRQTYCEPFAGGSGLSIKLLKNNLVESVWINDYDKSIYSVWHAILNHPDQLIDRINQVPFDYTGSSLSDDYNLEYWNEQRLLYLKSKKYQNSIDNAFSTLFLNRTNRSGIISGGPIGGYTQENTKVYERFNKKTLIDKINFINSMSDRIKLTRMDALDMIPQIRTTLDVDNDFIFFDPPYFEQGSHLYYSSFGQQGHKDLSKEILSLTKHKWITTYDKNPQIADIYSLAKQQFEYELNYTANNRNRGKHPELMFASPTLKIQSYEPVLLKTLN